MNVVALVGRLTADPEIRYSEAGTAICTFRLAVDRAGGEKGAAGFFPVVVFKEQAEAVANHVVKGRRVGVEGRLQHRTWEKDGQQRSTIEVLASRVDFLDSPPKDQETP